MLRKQMISYGTDPEGFFKFGDRIIGSEKVLTEGHLGSSYSNKVVLDGVQFELNPLNSTDLKYVGRNIGYAFSLLRSQLSLKPGVSVCFDGVVEVTREELDSLSEKSRILGCAPSRNIYGSRPITVDAKTYRKRSAGGHLHLGLTSTNIYNQKSVDERNRLIPLLDIFVGNTCVLLDRDPNAAERRENYGRAGEYRLPKHGVEYRTLSNFWLRNHVLFTFVFGMAELATAVLNETLTTENDLENELVEIVNIDRVIEAIDTNRADLAWQNFQDIRPFILRHVPSKSGLIMHPGNIEKFVVFATSVQEHGLDKVFPEDPLSHWTSGNFEDYINFIERVQ